MCKSETWWVASMWVYFKVAMAYGYLLWANWWMVGSPCGKCSFTSNLFHLFWSNYQPRCLWVVDYLCPASLAACPDRRTAISHFTIWTQPPRMRSLLWWGLCLWSPGYHGWQRASSSLSLSLESWFDGNMDTGLNYRDITSAKCTDVINSRQLPSNG